ncbi:MAG: ribosome small subunit-dependent GTPase A [Flavisolibacter sp.]
MQGIVYKSTGSWYLVKDASGVFWNARMKGVFKLNDITSTNPIAVGDAVDFDLENEIGHSAMITRIHDRRNYINRQSPKVKSQQHIVASNIDQSLLIATIKEPRTSQGFIDRFLVACEMYHVPAAVIFNKTDLYKQKEMDRFEKMRDVYESVGYKVFALSLKEENAMIALRDILINKITLVSGHSGVGKSTLINSRVPQRSVKTQEVSGWSGKGQHTTTFAEMFELPFAGRIIDTPGIKEFGIIGVETQELSGYFPEMKMLLAQCQFNNCLHTSEPGCAVKDGVINGVIDEDRYVSYCNILSSLEPHHY